MTVRQPLEVLFELDRIAAMFHKDIQADKRAALLSVARLMAAARAEWVITGGLATQRYVQNPRFTRDVDVIVRPEDEAALVAKLAEAPFLEEFELVHRKRKWTALVHRPSGTPVDINSSSLFQSVLLSPEHFELEGVDLPFGAPLRVAYTKLRTQHPRWPRKAGRRAQDRADLIHLLEADSGLYQDLRAIAEDRLLPILDAVWVECQGPAEDKELIPDSDPTGDEP